MSHTDRPSLCLSISSEGVLAAIEDMSPSLAFTLDDLLSESIRDSSDLIHAAVLNAFASANLGDNTASSSSTAKGKGRAKPQRRTSVRPLPKPPAQQPLGGQDTAPHRPRRALPRVPNTPPASCASASTYASSSSNALGLIFPRASGYL
ncbi:hypothetical protein BD626DRAFT_565253 [Schizophyllum amplum]|uniref:Uncharacterized protein n=1 Tax=Schizophyllum amplum TaxID=97359 RepID=A0A550CUE8_9AGAR|nr:hypothetical protein BD626DRAFT_565253 [Auriculariopsis ampla]